MDIRGSNPNSLCQVPTKCCVLMKWITLFWQSSNQYIHGTFSRAITHSVSLLSTCIFCSHSPLPQICIFSVIINSVKCGVSIQACIECRHLDTHSWNARVGERWTACEKGVVISSITRWQQTVSLVFTISPYWWHRSYGCGVSERAWIGYRAWVSTQT